MTSKSSPKSADVNMKKENLNAVVANLRVDLEAERKLAKTLRREKQIEVQRAREEEKVKASTTLKELHAKLNDEKRNEIELLKLDLKSKLETDFGKVVKQKDQKIKRLKQDLAKVQDELKEEITKRGLSTSVRGTFEMERGKLLHEIQELKCSKKKLEGAINAAEEKVKHSKSEIRRVEENCKQEIGKVEREARNEVRKLLDELKVKDNLLAMMDHNLYPDKASALKNQIANLGVEQLAELWKEIGYIASRAEDRSLTEDSSPVSATLNAERGVVSAGWQNIALQKRIYEVEKQLKVSNALHRHLIEKNKSLLEEKKLKDEELNKIRKLFSDQESEWLADRKEIIRLNDVIATLRESPEFQETNGSEQLEECRKYIEELQDEILSLRAECEEKERRIDLLLHSEKRCSRKKESKVVRFLLPGETSKINKTEAEEDYQNADELLIQSIYKDYEILMIEHLKLEQAYAIQLQHRCNSGDTRASFETWSAEGKEHLTRTIAELEHQLRQSNDRQTRLQHQLQDAYDQNEEIQFRLFELEETADKEMTTFYSAKEDVAIMEKVRNLENLVKWLRNRLAKFENIDIESLENEARSEFISNPQHKLSEENLRKLASSLSESDEDDDAMIQSFSTMTSGFDEISNISLEIDDRQDMPSENVDAAAATENNSPCAEKVSTDVDVSSDARSRETRGSAMPCVAADLCVEKNEVVETLQQQVDLLEDKEFKIRLTLENLAAMEVELTTLIERNKPPSSSNRITCDEFDDISYWTTCCERIHSALAELEESIFDGGCSTKTDRENEALQALETCLVKLKDACQILNECHQASCFYVEKIAHLETEIENDFGLTEFVLKLNDLRNCLYTFSKEPCDLTSISELEIIPPLKLMAFQQVASAFQSDFSDLKSLTEQFFNENRRHEEETKESSADYENVRRSPLKLDTNCTPSSEPRFDFLSPTGFDTPQWNNDGHMEMINQCLLQQIQDIEKGKEELKETIYNQNHSISELKYCIREFEQQTLNLNSIIAALNAKNNDLQKMCTSKEASFQQILEELSTAKQNLLDLSEKLSSTEASEDILRHELVTARNALEHKRDVMEMQGGQRKQSEKQLNKIIDEKCKIIDDLKLSNANLKQQVTVLESSDKILKNKVEELEWSLNSACDEMLKVARKRDNISQDVDILRDENNKLAKELLEAGDKNTKNEKEIEQLNETENFLKEANRKLWLSLQAAMDEKEQRRVEEMKNFDSAVGRQIKSCGDLASMNKGAPSRSKCNTSHTESIIAYLKKIILYAGTFHPTALKDTIELVFSESGGAQMERFKSTLRFNMAAAAVDGQECSSSRPNDDTANEGKVDKEDELEFWKVVEDLNDLYDMRIAQKDSHWKELENAMRKKNDSVLQLQNLLLSHCHSAGDSNDSSCLSTLSSISMKEPRSRTFMSQIPICVRHSGTNQKNLEASQRTPTASRSDSSILVGNSKRLDDEESADRNGSVLSRSQIPRPIEQRHLTSPKITERQDLTTTPQSAVSVSADLATSDQLKVDKVSTEYSVDVEL